MKKSSGKKIWYLVCIEKLFATFSWRLFSNISEVRRYAFYFWLDGNWFDSVLWRLQDRMRYCSITKFCGRQIYYREKNFNLNSYLKTGMFWKPHKLKHMFAITIINYLVVNITNKTWKFRITLDLYQKNWYAQVKMIYLTHKIFKTRYSREGRVKFPQQIVLGPLRKTLYHITPHKQDIKIYFNLKCL